MSLVDLFTNDSLFADFDRLLDNALPRGTQWRRPWHTQLLGGQLHVLNPRVDVREDKEKNLVSATFELPGMNRENVPVDVHNNLLTVSGESKSESESNDSWYLLRERHFGRFSRTFPVPEGVKPEEIKASMENGVLTVSYPRHSKKVAVS
ncbi:hypothetical protein V8D89_004906 [Ganoderma adspersum]